MAEITDFQHPDSIWTWQSNKRGAKHSLWLPYVSKADKVARRTWRFTYNGGEIDVDISKLDCIMFYGASGMIPVELIDELAAQRIPLLVHRRNIGRPSVFLPAPHADESDILTRQILARTNKTKCSYIARTLVRERFRAISDVMSVSNTSYRRLARSRTLAHVRAWEAEHSKKYWARYFSRIGRPGLARREEGPIQSALNAGSMFMSGIFLRWVLMHRLSPSHGYLHEGSGYMALVYDLMEPTRYMIEQAVAAACMEASPDSKDITKPSLSGLKRLLDTIAYIPATRQFVRRKNLLHGSVLALRAYLAGDMRRFVVPCAGERRGGRPPKVPYRLPGSIPGYKGACHE